MDAGELGGLPPRPTEQSTCPGDPAAGGPSSASLATSSCASCGAADHACGAMPQDVECGDVTLACTSCFLMPLLVVIAAVAMLYETTGEVVAFLIGAAAWIVLLWGGKFVSRYVRRHRSGE